MHIPDTVPILPCNYPHALYFIPPRCTHINKHKQTHIKMLTPTNPCTPLIEYLYLPFTNYLHALHLKYNYLHALRPINIPPPPSHPHMYTNTNSLTLIRMHPFNSFRNNTVNPTPLIKCLYPPSHTHIYTPEQAVSP